LKAPRWMSVKTSKGRRRGLIGIFKRWTPTSSFVWKKGGQRFWGRNIKNGPGKRGKKRKPVVKEIFGGGKKGHQH